MSMQTMHCLLLLLLLLSCEATVDLNIHQLEYVADHLTLHECRQVTEALHDHTHYVLDVSRLTGTHEPPLPCIDLLIRWNEGEGRSRTFLDLSLRLREVGRHALAGKLSRAVYHEKSQAVQRTLLDDPFRAMIHRDSPLLAEAAVYDHRTKEEAEEGPDQTARMSVQDIVIITVGALLLAGAVGAFLWWWLCPFPCGVPRKCRRFCACGCLGKTGDYYDEEDGSSDHNTSRMIRGYMYSRVDTDSDEGRDFRKKSPHRY